MSRPTGGTDRGTTDPTAVMGIDFDPQNPPPQMRTLVYAPDVQVFVAHEGKQIDVSRDIVRVEVIKVENSASSLFVTLANKDGRYGKGNLLPMDRVTVFMKRIKWVQVFSGYLDTVPFRQLYQGVITLKATCTLKRLLHTQWNPGLPASAQLFNTMAYAQELAGDGQVIDQGGLGNLLAKLLTEVGGWQRSNIHIANFPTSFYTFLVKQATLTQAANEAAATAFKHMLLGDDITPGAGKYASYNTDAGTAGPRVVGSASYIAEIIAACDEMGLGPNTTNLALSQQLVTGAGEGQAGLVSALDGGQNKAWETTGEAGAALYTASMNQDAAILGVACAMAESGLQNRGNLAVPESIPLSDGSMGPDHDSVGLFQQRNLAEWGSVSQRMNPRQSARMFFQHLARIDWRNTDPGQAIYQVQRGGSPGYYTGFVQAAQKAVSTYREAQQGLATTIAANPLTGALSSVAGAAGVDVASTVKAVTNVATSTPTTAGVRSQLGKPNPDSEGAVMTALEQQGKPYHWGARGPAAFDCSGLFSYAFKSIGLDIGGWTGEQFAKGTPVSPGSIRRGDLVFMGIPSSPEGAHVVMWMGDGTVLHAPHEGDVVRLASAAAYNPFTAHGIRRYADNGGPDPTAPRTDPMLAGPGVSPATGGTSTGIGGGAGGNHEEGIARNLFSYMFMPSQFVSEVAALWSQIGKDFIDSQPLMQMVQAVCRASLRNFQSAPNGDFMAYFPDHFGLEGKPAVMRLEDIELKDVHINFSDDQLTTHVYVAGDYTMQGFDQGVLGWINTAGVATVEDEWLFARLSRVGLGDFGSNLSGQALMARYGVRPYQATFTMAGSHELELLLATQIFMEKWAAQYETRVSFTFMPELLPGMRIEVGDHNLQVYVTEVHHSCDYEQGFSTDAVIMAPSNPNSKELMARSTSQTLTNSTTALIGTEVAG